jgi:hypothetical protein
MKRQVRLHVAAVFRRQVFQKAFDLSNETWGTWSS